MGCYFGHDAYVTGYLEGYYMARLLVLFSLMERLVKGWQTQYINKFYKMICKQCIGTAFLVKDFDKNKNLEKDLMKINIFVKICLEKSEV